MNRLRNTLGLDTVNLGVRPSEMISALSETCEAAVTQIVGLRSQIKELQGRLSRLMLSKETQAEIEFLLKENEQLKRQLERIQKQLTKLELLLKENDELKNRLEGLKEQLTKMDQTIVTDPEAIKKIIRENEELRRQLHDKPPNIQISEQKEDYRFKSGSSVMAQTFIEGLRQNEFARLAGEIIDREAEGRVKVDTLEIIGHTDGLPLSGDGNLDQKLPDFLTGSKSKISSLTPGSNNDLGLLRALAVREQWESFIDVHDQRVILRKIHIRCYSAGQTILPYEHQESVADDFRQSDPRARRIEMRLTRLLNR
jgi:flagellar motor protein MotB